MRNILKLKLKYFIFFILIIIFAFSMKFTNSRYVSSKATNGNLQIAKPIIEYENVSATSFGNMLPGEFVEYYFNIKNTDNTSVNEVLLNYYIEVTFLDNNLPIVYTIYDVTSGNEVKLTTNSNKTELIPLGFENIETHRYKIKFEWAASDNAEAYANKNTTINIDVFAEQVVN